MSDRDTKLSVAIWRLQSASKIADQRAAAADILDEFYEDATLQMIARVLRGEKQNTDVPRRDVDRWAYVKTLQADGHSYEKAVQLTASAMCIGAKAVEGSVSICNKAGLIFR